MGSVITLLKRSFQSFGSDQCSTLAAAIAYNTIFALFPIALFGVAVLGYVVGGAAARQNVVDAITKVIPLGDTGRQALDSTLKGTSSAKGWLSLIGIVTAAWGASGLFGNIRQALDSVWDVDRPLPLLRAKARDLLLLVVFGGLLLASTISTGLLQGARTAGSHAPVIGPLVTLAGPVFLLLTLGVPLVITFVAFMFLHRMAPHARLNWGDVWPAATVAALFFSFGSNLLTFYIAHLGNFNALAGSLGAAILFLVFVYYSAQVVLLGAEISKQRLLVASGAVPATNPKSTAPSVPLTQKVKNTLTRLWVIEEPHHEPDLPYHPGRLDPVHNEPTNSKEEVLFNIEQSQEQAQEDAARAGKASAPGGRAAGLDQRKGKPAAAAPFGYAAELRGETGQPPERRRSGRQDNNLLWKGIGYLIALVLAAIVKRRERGAAKAKETAARDKQQARRTRILIR